MPRLGQHFLRNKKVLAEIVSALELRAGDVIFEIGPGHGELTEQLKLSAEGGKIDKLKIVSIEKDKKLCELLKKRFKNDGQIEITCGDALKQLPLLISKFRNFDILKYKLAGNIPYYITGHLLRIMSELNNKPGRSVLTVQEEVASRITGQPATNTMNRLAASVQFWAEPKILMNVPKYDFHPAPKVDSTVILLLKKDFPMPCNTHDYYVAVRTVFSQPRKTVLNNILSGIDVKKNGIYKKEGVASALKHIGIDPECRPQNLSVLNIVDIAKTFFGG